MRLTTFSHFLLLLTRDAWGTEADQGRVIARTLALPLIDQCVACCCLEVSIGFEVYQICKPCAGVQSQRFPSFALPGTPTMSHMLRRDQWGLVVDSSWVVELDSSNPLKFSRHIIVQVPGAAFQDALNAGAFSALVLQLPGLVRAP
jgi:hypothetical protein